MTERATVFGALTNARYVADTQVPEMTREAYADIRASPRNVGNVPQTRKSVYS
jgi:hypothetical protein